MGYLPPPRDRFYPTGRDETRRPNLWSRFHKFCMKNATTTLGLAICLIDILVLMIYLLACHRETINNILEGVICGSAIGFPIYTVIYFVYDEYRNSRL